MNPNLTNPVIVTRLADMREQELRRDAEALGDVHLTPEKSPARTSRAKRQGQIPFFAWIITVVTR